MLISFDNPHKAVNMDTMERLVKNTLKHSGIDTEQFACHSTRSALTSCTEASCLILEQIKQSAGWSTSSAFGSALQPYLILQMVHNTGICQDRK